MRTKPTPISPPILTPISPPRPASGWTSGVRPVAPVRAGFAALAPADQRLLEAVVFEGCRCTDLAGSLGIAASELRRRLGAILLRLHAKPTGWCTAAVRHAPRAADAVDCDAADQAGPGAVAAMLALHAADALDPDEAALIDAMLAHQPALQRAHAGYCDLVAELCLVTPVEPSPGVASRLLGALGDDTAAN